MPGMDRPGDNRHRRILVVDDDQDIREAVREVLEEDGYEVRTADGGVHARAKLEETRFDLIILDLMLPDTDGLLLCAEFSRLGTPVLVCIPSDRHRAGTLALWLGADSVVSKPLDLEEFRARVARLLVSTQRTKAASRNEESHRLAVSNLRIDRKHGVRVGEADLEFSPTEFRLLFALGKAADRVVSRSQLAETVWGYQDPLDGRAIDVHVSRLRSKLNSASANISIDAVRGEGYKLRSHPRDLPQVA